MPSVTGTGGESPSRHRTSRAARTARTLVAVIAVGCVGMTAAAADPSGLAPPAPSDVFAAGEGGLGRLDLSAGPSTRRPDGPLVASSPSVPADAGSLDGLAELGGFDEFGNPVSVPEDLAGIGEGFLASAVPSGLAPGEIPTATLRAYRAAAQVLAREEPACAIDWALLAGIGRVESNHGRFGGATVTSDGRSVPAILGVRLDGSLAGTMVIRDTDGAALDGDPEYDRAVGPMQFLPGTWKRWGSDGDRDGVQDPQDIDDAALAAARYLCGGAGGLDQPGPAAAAVRRYNNSTEYVQLVLSTAAGYRDGGPTAFPVTGYGEPTYSTAEAYPDAPGWAPPPVSAIGRTPGALTPGPVVGSGAGPTQGPSVTPTGRPGAAPAPTESHSASAPPTRPHLTTRPSVTTRPSATTPPSTPPVTTPPDTTPPVTTPPGTTPPGTTPPGSTPPVTTPPVTTPPVTTPPGTTPPVTTPPGTTPPPSSGPPTTAPPTSVPPTSPPASDPPATCEPVPGDESSPPPGTDPPGEPCELPPCTEPAPTPTDAEPTTPGCDDPTTDLSESAGITAVPPVG